MAPKCKTTAKGGARCNKLLIRPQACKLLVSALTESTCLTVYQAFTLSRLLESYVFTWAKQQPPPFPPVPVNNGASTTHLFPWHHVYSKKILQLETGVRLNATFLLETYELHELIHLTNSELAHGSSIETAHKQYLNLLAEREALLYTMLHPDSVNKEDLVDTTIQNPPTSTLTSTLSKSPTKRGRGGLRCSRCYSNSIALEQKQTRGADESMTIFCECNKCGKRWRM